MYNPYLIPEDNGMTDAELENILSDVEEWKKELAALRKEQEKLEDEIEGIEDDLRGAKTALENYIEDTFKGI